MSEKKRRSLVDFDHVYNLHGCGLMRCIWISISIIICWLDSSSSSLIRGLPGLFNSRERCKDREPWDKATIGHYSCVRGAESSLQWVKTMLKFLPRENESSKGDENERELVKSAEQREEQLRRRRERDRARRAADCWAKASCIYYKGSIHFELSQQINDRVRTDQLKREKPGWELTSWRERSQATATEN